MAAGWDPTAQAASLPVQPGPGGRWFWGHGASWAPYDATTNARLNAAQAAGQAYCLATPRGDQTPFLINFWKMSQKNLTTGTSRPIYRDPPLVASTASATSASLASLAGSTVAPMAGSPPVGWGAPMAVVPPSVAPLSVGPTTATSAHAPSDLSSASASPDVQLEMAGIMFDDPAFTELPELGACAICLDELAEADSHADPGRRFAPHCDGPHR